MWVEKVIGDEKQLEHVSKFKYLWFAVDDSGADGAEWYKKVASLREVVGAIKSLAIVRSLQLDFVKGIQERLQVLVWLYESEALVGRKKVISGISAVQIDKLTSLLGKKRLNAEFKI